MMTSKSWQVEVERRRVILETLRRDGANLILENELLLLEESFLVDVDG